MFDLSELFAEYMMHVRGHAPMVPLSDEDYFTLFKRGLRRMYIDTGRAPLYEGKASFEEKRWPFELGPDEQEYVLLAAQCAFYGQMMADATGGDHITQHKTDALTVTFSDKTVQHLSDVVRHLDDQLADLYHKMPQFTVAVSS